MEIEMSKKKKIKFERESNKSVPGDVKLALSDPFVAATTLSSYAGLDNVMESQIDELFEQERGLLWEI
jgi:hypothetical protein